MSDTTFPAFASSRRLPNLFDLAAIICVFGVLFGVASVARGTLAPLSAPHAGTVSLDPANLPFYAVRTTLRMFAALLCSLLFTFTYATFAAKSRRAALLLIPALDILQSVPILGFLSFTVIFFMNLFPGRVLGAELASIFAIFTSQAWNMAFSMYQSLRTVPADLDEAARAFRLTHWQRFWRLEVPFAVPGLVWNTMMSMSGGWFFVTASEAISVGNTTFSLPGIGSYVALALAQRNLAAVLYAILAMLVVILLYDQLLFRPLVAWSARFRFETVPGATAEDPWVLALWRRTRLLRWIGGHVERLPRPPHRHAPRSAAEGAAAPRTARRASSMRSGSRCWPWRSSSRCDKIITYVAASLSWSDLLDTLELGCFTLVRVVVLMALATLVWVPVGVWLGLRPAWARRAQPVAQFLAAFPANLFFPIFVVAIVRLSLDPDVWLSPLMILGTQWYLLFNVIAGAAAFPGDLKEAAANFHIGGWLWWRRVMLPGIFPYFVTGAITASGGSWNAAIVAEVASWGRTKLVAHGLGAYIAQATDAGEMPKVVLGVVVMSGFVLLFNRLLWRPLYAYSSRRLTL